MFIGTRKTLLSSKTDSFFKLLATRGNLVVPSCSRSGTNATVMCFLENAVAGDAQFEVTLPANIPRLAGYRWVASTSSWSNTYSDGTTIEENLLLGALSEPTATNLVTGSHTLTTGWSTLEGYGVSLTQNAAVYLDGETSSPRLADTNTTGRHGVFYSASPVLSGRHTVRFTLRHNVGAGYVRIALSASTGFDFAYMDVDLRLGTITNSAKVAGTVTNAIGSISQVKSGVYEVILAATPSSYFSYVVLCFSNVAAAAAGTNYGFVFYAGTSSNAIDVLSCQVEAGSKVTSIIKTTTTTATRNADVLTYPTLGIVDSTKGSLIMEVTPTFNIPTGTTAGYGSNYLIDFGTNNGSIYVNNQALTAIDGTYTATTPPCSPFKGTTYKLASKWGSSGRKNFLSGVVGTGVSFDGSINAGNSMTIGGRGSDSTYNAGCYIKNIKIYKSSLSDSTLVSATQLNGITLLDSFWDTTAKGADLVLSNGNKTVTSTNTNGQMQFIQTDTDIISSTYMEFTGYLTLNAGESIGICLKQTSPRASAPSGSVYYNENTGGTNVYGISYNPVSGAYKIKRNNILVTSGTLADTGDMRIFVLMGGYSGTSTFDTCTIKTSNFTYMPEYL